MSSTTVIEFSTRKPVAGTPPKPTWQWFEAVLQTEVADGYVNGNISGKAAGLALLRLIQVDPEGAPYLNFCVQAILLRESKAATKGQRDAWQGKLVGLLAEINPWLTAALGAYSSKALEAATPESIGQMLRDAAEGLPERALEQRIWDDRSRAAKEGWARRRAAKLLPAQPRSARG